MSEPNIYAYINQEQERLHAAKNSPGVNGCALFPWRERLILNKDGDPKALLANAITALRVAPEWEQVLAFNEFSNTTTTLKPAPWLGSLVGIDWTDHDDRNAANWLQHQGIYVSVDVAAQAVQTVAKDRSFHPVRTYLDSITWDGTKRIESWLSLYLGVTPSDYSMTVGARWLISAVACIFRPGAKVDCCLILEGEQGMKKSTALRVLAGEWFTDEIAELGTKDAAMQTRGVWIIELDELDSMTRTEVSRVKAFMSRATDRFRPPYGKRLAESPRQCVFAGSVNHSTYLRDETGGRRFWPVACTRILIDQLRRDRDQLWAEAVVQYRANTPWWLDTPHLSRLAQVEQSDRYDDDPWQELISEWLNQPQPSPRRDGAGYPDYSFTSTTKSVTVTDILLHCIGKPGPVATVRQKSHCTRTSFARLGALQGPAPQRLWRESHETGEAAMAVSPCAPCVSVMVPVMVPDQTLSIQRWSQRSHYARAHIYVKRACWELYDLTGSTGTLGPGPFAAVQETAIRAPF